MKSVLSLITSLIINVAPLVGAWIEIEYHRQTRKVSNVAPLVGAWIEIEELYYSIWRTYVAPLVGAWIEIFLTCQVGNFLGCSLT